MSDIHITSELITITVVSGILMPFVYFVVKFLIKMISEMTKGFDNLGIKIDSLGSKIGKTELSNEKLVKVARNEVWFASKSKIEFIRGRLEKNDIKKRRIEVKKSIKVELISQSNIYVSYLNQFYNHKIGSIGDYISENFDMDTFLEEVYDVVFREDISIEKKLYDIQFIMSDYQNQLFHKMENDMK